MTYRWYDHSGFAGSKAGVDGAFGLPYRSDSDVKTWMARDPIARFKQFLLDRKLFTEEELTTMENDVQKAVDASIEFARKSPLTKPEDGLLNVYAKGSVEPTQFLNGKPTAWVPQPDLAVNGWNIRLDT
jgi:pyruvate dehydrogenase E1 component alpha subunit